MSRNDWWKWWEKYGWYVLGPIFMAIAFVIGKYLESQFHSQVITELAIALWIAGILMMTVDPFIKRLANREATRDIFHHMMGFDLPLPIRERIQEMVLDTKLYRENVVMRVEMKEKDKFTVFHVEMDFTIRNPNNKSWCFTPLLQFENGERAELVKVICFGNLDYGIGATLKPVGNLGAMEFKGKPFPIPANSCTKFKYEYSVAFPTELGFWQPSFTLPTTGVSLTIKYPEHFEVKATDSQEQAPEGEWRYPKKLWMQGEHLDIVWKKA
ncbi:MAG TPA: hypothetical protein VFE61_10055 [Candidatus Sulfotelmatobacter sp.]|jgi:hypothetical protein|nr:hypothetical protein [Candidatus Sulfotelmatobacter sp.]